MPITPTAADAKLIAASPHLHDETMLRFHVSQVLASQMLTMRPQMIGFAATSFMEMVGRPKNLLDNTVVEVGLMAASSIITGWLCDEHVAGHICFCPDCTPTLTSFWDGRNP